VGISECYTLDQHKCDLPIGSSKILDMVVDGETELRVLNTFASPEVSIMRPPCALPTHTNMDRSDVCMATAVAPWVHVEKHRLPDHVSGSCLCVFVRERETDFARSSVRELFVCVCEGKRDRNLV
jgi:hypothetical protein